MVSRTKRQNGASYEREMEILREGRIFDHNVSEREWRLMKKLGTLVPLGDEK